MYFGFYFWVDQIVFFRGFYLRIAKRGRLLGLSKPETVSCLAIARLILAIVRVLQEPSRRGFRYSETQARYSEIGAED